jgi:hypothetical protein
MSSKTTRYQLISNPSIGLSIVEENGTYYLWIDDYEGGEATITDWNYIDEFGSEELTMDYIKLNYGEVKEL